MTRPRSTTAARLLLACCLVGLVVSVSPTLAQDATPPGAAVEAVTVDETPPAFSYQPESLFVDAVDADGAYVEYILPSATDDSGVLPVVSCAPISTSVFPIGVTPVTCYATDGANNSSAPVVFQVTVTDITPPVATSPGNIGPLEGGAQLVGYEVWATDREDGDFPALCDITSGSLFEVGSTTVTCSAVDRAGNPSVPVSFLVLVNAAPTPVPTATDVPEPTKADPTKKPAPEPTKTSQPDPTKTPQPTDTPAPTETVTATTTPTATATETTDETAVAVSTPPALSLSWPPPESFTLVGDGGPLDGLEMMWDNDEYPISQEFGHTWFSVRHSSWYAYGRAYGLDGFEHTGLDIGMPRGTPLYSPVAGTVKIAGGTPYFTFYGNGQPGVGELLIETDDGHEIVLGHMGLITVQVGTRVEFGELVGLSGGDNGDHLHFEVRQRGSGGGLRLVDPRRSFLIEVIEEALAAQAGEGAVASSRRSDEADAPEGTSAPDDDPEERGLPS